MATGWGAPPASRAVATDEQRVALVRSSITGFVQRNPDAVGCVSVVGCADRWCVAVASYVVDVGGGVAAFAGGRQRGDQHGGVRVIGEGAGVEFLEWRA